MMKLFIDLTVWLSSLLKYLPNRLNIYIKMGGVWKKVKGPKSLLDSVGSGIGTIHISDDGINCSGTLSASKIVVDGNSLNGVPFSKIDFE